ncbi:hypothetical protein LSH36_158g04017 [Paralvinella palmiformis]|uniref:Prefoldin subunit 1 n=1 Tax=Paralvinella palmiformis TaxID=53620 RepID=A0AAD9JVB5_9ANNE|nr:hypothetical protein LSH36_158g04017 [Paralvinella palmiformis]
MSGQPAVDMELKKAFQELQTKMIITQQQMKVSDMQIDQLKRQIAHAALVEKELNGLTQSTRTYEGVGRMFLLQPIDTVKQNLVEKVKANEDKIKTIETTKTYLEKNMKESEDNLRELVFSKQKQRT